MSAELPDPSQLYCGLCDEPKTKIANSTLICLHCDGTRQCPGGRCGACVKVTAKRYPDD